MIVRRTHGGLVALVALLALVGCPGPMRAKLVTEPAAARWAPFVAMPPPPPTPGASTPNDLDAVLAWQARRTQADMAAIAYWDGGAPAWRFDAEARRLAETSLLPTVAAARALAATQLAMADAAVACWRLMADVGRAPPAVVDARVKPAVAAAPDPSWPCAHAAVAVAAAEVLGHLFPPAAAGLDTKARAVGETRVAAGLAFPSDVAAGRDVGHAVALAVIARLEAMSDGAATPAATADADPDAELPGAGAWPAWLTAPCPAPSPPPGSGLAGVVAANAHLDIRGRNLADKWLADEPAARWARRAADEVQAHALSLPRAVRLLARTDAAAADAAVCAWRLAYQARVPRPKTLAPLLEPVRFPPAHPAWPDDGAAIAAAHAVVLGEAFPAEAKAFASDAAEAAEAGFLGAHHYRRDGIDGLAIGRTLGEAAAAGWRAEAAPEPPT